MNLVERLSEIVLNSESYKKIMADGVVEDREVEEQSQLVDDLFSQIERRLGQEDFALVSQAIAELCVLNAIYRYNQAYIQTEM